MLEVMSALHSLVRRTTDGRSIAVVRVVVGCAVMGEGLMQWHLLTAMLQPHMIAMPLADVPRLPLNAVPTFVGLWLLSAAAFAAGWRIVATGPLLAGLLGYALILDEQTYSNHLYLMVLIVALVTCAGGGGHRAIAAWPRMLLKAQLSIVYAFAALSKVNAAYLSGAVFLVTVRAEVWDMLPAAVRAPQVMTTLALLAIVFELFLAFALWSNYWRRAAVLLGTAFHVLLALLLQVPYFALVGFGAIMISLYGLFHDEGPILAYEFAVKSRRRLLRQLRLARSSIRRSVAMRRQLIVKQGQV